MKSDAIIDRLGWKPLSERRDEHIKELFNKCPKDKEHVPDLFKNYFNTRRILLEVAQIFLSIKLG